MERALLLFGLLTALLLSVFSYSLAAKSEPVFLSQHGHVISRIADSGAHLPATIVFVGDVMLGRDVERKMNVYGSNYPFLGSTDLFRSRYVVANFEAAIPEKHYPTPNGNLRFSVNPYHLDGLVTARITHASLANNHSFDFGQPGLESTKYQLALRELVAFGEPNKVATTSTSYLILDNQSVALVGLNSVGAKLAKNDWKAELERLESSSNLQIAYVHWGDEYVGQSNVYQQKLGRELIDAGFDLVIGHHPHVVQEIEEYNGKLIFYSLGNYVFDQYFSEEVQTGLALRLSVKPDGRGVEIDLVPVSSVGIEAQPQRLDEEEVTQFLYVLASKSSQSIAKSILEGRLRIGL